MPHKFVRYATVDCELDHEARVLNHGFMAPLDKHFAKWISGFRADLSLALVAAASRPFDDSR
jgi:hypothetical protein